MVRNFIMKGLLILHIMNAAVSGDEYMKVLSQPLAGRTLFYVAGKRKF